MLTVRARYVKKLNKKSEKITDACFQFLDRQWTDEGVLRFNNIRC
jgi:hypothetical protein